MSQISFIESPFAASAQLAGDGPRIGRERIGLEPEREITEAGDVDRPAGRFGWTPVAMQQPGVVTVVSNLEPPAESPVVPDRDARPASVPAVSCLPFAVAREPAER